MLESVDLHFVWEGPGVFLLCQWEIQCYLIYLYKGHRVGGHKCVGCKFGLFCGVDLYIVGQRGKILETLGSDFACRECRL